MISSVFALKESNTIPEYLAPVRETGLEENYYYNDSLNFLLECQKELLECKQGFYKTILETDNQYVVNEAFDDILMKVKEIIKKILAYIESIVQRFITALGKFFASDKYIIKMKKELTKFPKDETFSISGYKYTLTDEVPAVDIVGLDLTELQIAVRNLEKDNSDIDVKITNLEKLIADFTSELKMEEARSQILNVNYKIADSSFANEIFAAYRDGKSEEHDMLINKEEVSRASASYEGYKDKIKAVNRLKSNITSKYKTLEKQVDNMLHTEISIDTTNTTSVKSKDDLNRLISKQVECIQRISNMHVQAFAAKLDAYNALMVQDKSILYKALNVVQKDIKNMRVMENYTCYDYTRDSAYKSYLLERHYMNTKQQRFVEECLALSESNIPELSVIQEDLKMDAKNLFEKIKAAVKSIFEKFMMKMNSLIMNEKKFLVKYKDIILTKKIPDEGNTFNDMPHYEDGIKNITGFKMKQLVVDNILDKTELQIQQELLPGYDGTGKFADYAKNFFLSDNNKNAPRDVKPSDLNMTELYSFCVKAEDAVKTIKTSFDNFYREADSVKNAVLSKINKSESVDIYGEKYYYSTVLEAFINEEGEENKDANDTSKMKLNVPSNDNKEDANKNIDKDVELKKEEDPNADKDKQVEKNANADSKKVQDTAKWYLNAISTINSAKITAFQKIWSEYMKILRYHVRKATGSMGSTDNFTEDDKKNIAEAIKKYREAKDPKDQKPAIDDVVNIYKSRQVTITPRDAEDIIKRNLNNVK